MDLAEKAREIIDNIFYITIASVSPNGLPWNTPVFSASDESYNFYWASDEYSQHSQNIKNNPLVFLVIYDSTVPEGKGIGVYIQANATILSDEEEIKKGFNLLLHRGTSLPWKLEDFLKSSRSKIYRATPTKIWINREGETGEKFIDTRIEVKL